MSETFLKTVEMGNVWYNEPKTLDTAFDVMGDIVLSTAAQQYGGFTVPEVDKILLRTHRRAMILRKRVPEIYRRILGGCTGESHRVCDRQSKKRVRSGMAGN